MAGQTVDTGMNVYLNGSELDRNLIVGLAIDSDLAYPDYATITLTKTKEIEEKARLGSSLEIRRRASVRTATDTLFKGEVVGVEPLFRPDGREQWILRALDRSQQVHRRRRR
jgi:hypothetical protein